MRIAILEDDPDQLSHLVRTMEQLFTVGETTVACTAFTDGAALQQVLRRESFDLLVLDWNVPGLEGLELLKWLRTWQRDLVPVLMLSSRTSEQDVVQALNFGADDYIVKPFQPDELFARLRAVMRRTHGRVSPVLSYNGVVLDPARREVTRDGAAVPLSSHEFRTLLLLMERQGRVVTREQLEEAVYGSSGTIESNTIAVYVHQLRRKLGEQLIVTVHGQGYRINGGAAA